MQALMFHLKGGQQKGELLLNIIFPNYPDGDDGDDGNGKDSPINEKESDNALSNSSLNMTSILIILTQHIGKSVWFTTSRQTI